MSDNTFKQNTFPEDKPEPEAAGQEQETAEAFLKAMKPQVADFDKHDKVAKVFDYYDMTGFAAQYASQQTASLQKQVESLKESLRIQMKSVDNLQKQVEELREEIKSREAVSQIDKKYIAELEEALKYAHDKAYVLYKNKGAVSTRFFRDAEKLFDAMEKALNPQDNQKEK